MGVNQLMPSPTPKANELIRFQPETGKMKLAMNPKKKEEEEEEEEEEELMDNCSGKVF